MSWISKLRIAGRRNGKIAVKRRSGFDQVSTIEAGLGLHDQTLEQKMYRLRFLAILLRCLISEKAPVDRERRLFFRAIPLIDTDFNRMFTHSYALFMGLARWHLLFGSQFRNLALRHKWAPVTTCELINYKRAIRAFQRFELRTRVIHWDEERFYVEQYFDVDGQTFVATLVQGLVRGPQGILKPRDVFAQAGYEGPAPEASQETKEQIALLKTVARQPLSPKRSSQ